MHHDSKYGQNTKVTPKLWDTAYHQTGMNCFGLDVAQQPANMAGHPGLGWDAACKTRFDNSTEVTCSCSEKAYDFIQDTDEQTQLVTGKR